MRERVYFIEHDGRRILFLDFSGIKRTDEALASIEHAKDVIALQPKLSLLTLTYVAGSTFNPEIAKALWRLARSDKPFVRAAAVVGISGMQEALLLLVQKMSRRTFATFDSLDEAKRWLAGQGG